MGSGPFPSIKQLATSQKGFRNILGSDPSWGQTPFPSFAVGWHSYKPRIPTPNHFPRPPVPTPSVATLLSGKIPLDEVATVKGWIRTRRDSKAGFSFLAVSDGSCFDSI